MPGTEVPVIEQLLKDVPASWTAQAGAPSRPLAGSVLGCTSEQLLQDDARFWGKPDAMAPAMQGSHTRPQIQQVNLHLSDQPEDLTFKRMERSAGLPRRSHRHPAPDPHCWKALTG